MRKALILLLIIGIIVLAGILLIEKNSEKKIEGNIVSYEEYNNTEKNHSINKELEGSENEAQGKSEGGDEVSRDAQNSEDNARESDERNKNLSEIPFDINVRECGFYYSGYGICVGVCPSGRCVSEGRSCYCKEV